MSLIEFKQVSKGFVTDRKAGRALIALNGLSLSVEEGEFVSLLGPSGCGKTVSLSMMAGFVAPTSGEVLFRGKPIDGPGPERGVVFQEHSLFPWLTVSENVVFAMKESAKARRTRFDAGRAREKALDVLGAVGLERFADARPNTLSGGMKQRVAIARLLAMDSEVLLMDEPFSALDEQTRGALDASLYRLWRNRRKTIVFVTHNISEAVAISSRIVLFSEAPGRVAHEWHLPEGFDRNPSSPEALALVEEIRSLMPLSSASF